MPRVFESFIALALFTVTACGGAAPASAPGPIAIRTVAVAPLVKVGDGTALGKIPVDIRGMSLYTWVKDTDENSQCYDACATAWPPLLSRVTTVAGLEVKGKLASSARKDGQRQVTYNGKPLYYFRSDVVPGDTKGQGSNGFGAPWLVVINP